MKKILVCLLLLAALSGFAAAQQDLTGLSVGAEAWNTPGKDNYDDNSFSIAPFAEFEKSIDMIELYLKGQHIINLDDETNQAFYLEEMLSLNLEGAGPGTLSLALDNCFLFGTMIDDDYPNNAFYFYGPDDAVYVDQNRDVKKMTGYFEPSASYTLENLNFAKELIFTLGLPIGYAPTGKDYQSEYIDWTAEFGLTHESGFGFSVKGFFNIDNKWETEGLDPDDWTLMLVPDELHPYLKEDDKSRDKFFELDAVVSFTKEDVFKASLEVDFFKNFDGDFLENFAFIPGVEVYLQNFTVYGKVDIRTFSDRDENWWNEYKKTSTGFLVGGKMKL